MAKHQNYWFDSGPPSMAVRSGIVRNADVLIIGGGVAGLLTLWQFLRSKADNTYLLEESVPGYRASGRSSGQLMMRGFRSFADIHHSVSEAASRDYIDFIAANNEIFRGVIADNQISCDMRESGGLRLAIDEEELAAIQEECDLITAANVGVTPLMLSKQEVENLVYSKRFAGAMYVPEESTFNPFMLTSQMAHKLNASGRRILNNCSVESVEAQDDGTFRVTVRNKGVIRAKNVVYCTNAYTPKLLPEFDDYMTPFRGQMIGSTVLQDNVQQVMPQMSMTCNYGREYFRTHKGRMLMGGMRHKVRGFQRDTVFDGEASQAVGRHLREFMGETFPYIKDAPDYVWTGIMSETSDGLPFVGAVPNKPGEFICAGFNGYGFSHALLAGCITRDLVLDGESKVPCTDMFDPARVLQNG